MITRFTVVLVKFMVQSVLEPLPPKPKLAVSSEPGTTWRLELAASVQLAAVPHRPLPLPLVQIIEASKSRPSKHSSHGRQRYGCGLRVGREAPKSFFRNSDNKRFMMRLLAKKV